MVNIWSWKRVQIERFAVHGVWQQLTTLAPADETGEMVSAQCHARLLNHELVMEPAAQHTPCEGCERAGHPAIVLMITWSTGMLRAWLTASAEVVQSWAPWSPVAALACPAFTSTCRRPATQHTTKEIS